MTADSASNAAAATTPPARKPRNVVELILVRGGILVLVLLAAVQAHARFGYEMSLKTLQARMASEEETTVPLLLSDVPKMIWGFPSRTEQEDRHWRSITYKWQGITQAYEIRMPYDSSETQPAILSLETADPPPPVPVAKVDVPETAAPSMPSMGGMPSRGGMGGGPGMGGAGGGSRPDLMASDADGDGRVSKAEAPEPMAPFFDRMDANSDGFIDQDEIAEAARRRAERQRSGGGSSSGGERPQRPATESDKPAEGTTKEADQPIEAAPAKETADPAEAPADATKPAP